MDPADDAAAITSTIHRLCSDELRVPECRNELSVCLASAATESLGSPDSVALRTALENIKELWTDLAIIWTLVVDNILDDDSSSWKELALSNAQFLRNLVAGVSSVQIKAIALEPSIRRLALSLTSFYALQDPENGRLVRVVMQTLGNIISGKEPAQDSIWTSYMSSDENSNVLLRVFASSDPKTKFVVAVVILNLTKGSVERTRQLVTMPGGVYICRAMMEHLKSALEGDEAEHTTMQEGLAVKVEIFKNIFDLGLFDELWQRLAIPGELIAPHQTTLLRLLDVRLQPPIGLVVQEIPLIQSLGSIFLETSDNSRTLIRALRKEGDAELPSDDSFPSSAQLAPVLESMVLMCQCLSSLLLHEQDDDRETRTKALMDIQTTDDDNAVDEVVDLLGELDRLLPRILLGKAQPSPNVSKGNQEKYSSPDAFPLIKRDLVRLLGVLSYKNKSVQDHARRIGGIQVVLNLCVVDERNPFLREHALFTLRNLLQDNEENQKFVDEIKPMVEWEETGELRRS